MNPSRRFRGTDAARLDELAFRATDVADRLALTRRTILVAADAGADAGQVDPTLRSLQEWLQRVAEDARRRAATTRAGEAAAGTPTIGAAVCRAGAGGGPVVTVATTEPVLHPDGASGLHLQGYVGVGLSWKHVGTETRVRTTATDYGDGWVRREAVTQKRAVYDVEVGAGYGPKRMGGLGQHRYRAGWRTGRRRTTYTHDGEVVSKAEFDAGTGSR